MAVYSKPHELEYARVLINTPFVNLHAENDWAFRIAPFYLQVEMVKKEPKYYWNKIKGYEKFILSCTTDLANIENTLISACRNANENIVEPLLILSIIEFAGDWSYLGL